MIERLFAQVTALPTLMRVGLLVLMVGGFLDVVYHASPASWEATLAAFLGPDAAWAHLVTLAGMCLTMLSVLNFRLATVKR